MLAMLAAVVSGATSTILLALLNHHLGNPAPASGQVMAVFFGLVVGVFVLRLTAERLLIRLAQETIFNLRMELSRRVLALELRELERIGPPRVLSTLTADVPTIAVSVNLLPLLCFNSTIVLACVVYLLVLSPKVFLFLVAMLVAGVVGYQVPIVYGRRHLFAARQTNDALYDHFQALLTGIKELKLHRRRRDAFLDRVLHDSAATYQRQSTAGMRIWATAGAIGQLVMFTLVGVLIFVLPNFGPATEGATVTGYILAILYMMQPLQFVMNSMPHLTRADIALRRIEKLGLDLDDHAGPKPALAPATPADWRRLELVGVAHVYRAEDQEFRLGPIDLRLEPGSVVFLVGGNGSGKTTLAKLILGLYPPTEGELRLDGRTIGATELEGYRELFSAIFAEFFLFEELLGLDTGELDQRAREYLERLHLDHKVTVRDGVLSTTSLSQGQRKRLALLTAYLEDRPIYLFDEWAADQDPSFKEIFYHSLVPELRRRGKTVLVISHDDAYFPTADRIVKMDYGKIVVDGPPEEYFAHLRRQSRLLATPEAAEPVVG